MELATRAKRKYRNDGAKSLILTTLSFIKYRLTRISLDLTRIKNYINYHIFNQSVLENKGVYIDISQQNLPTEESNEVLNNQFGPGIENIETIGRYVSDADTDLLEIGAGSGFQSCIINNLLGKNQRHITVEANKNLKPILESVRSLNNCNYEILMRAYSVRDDTVELNVHTNYKNSTILHGRDDISGKMSVETTTIHQLKNEFNLTHFLLYANIEGAEYELLNEEMETIQNCCPVVIISFHSFTDDNHEEYIDRMKEEFIKVDKMGSSPGTFVFNNPNFEPSE